MSATQRPLGHGQANVLTRSWPAGTGRVTVLAVALFSAALALGWLAVPVPRLLAADTTALLVAVTVAFALTEANVLHLEWHDHAYSLSLSELPLVLGLFFVDSPALLVVARVVGGAVTLAFLRRQPLPKLLFNVCSQSLEVTVAVAVFGWLGGGADTSAVSIAWPAATGAALAASLSSTVAVIAAITLAVGRYDRKLFPEFARSGLVSAAANATAGLVVVLAVWQDRAAVLPILVLFLVLALVYRAYTSLHKRHTSLELLHEFTRSLDRSTMGDQRVRSVLERSRDLLRAGVAEICLLDPEDGTRTHRFTLAAGDTAVRSTADGAPTEWPWVRVLTDDRTVVIPRGTKDAGLARFLAGRELQDCILAPLHADSGVVGTLLVGNRRGDVATFTEDDGRLFHTIATHAASAIENGRLLDRLAHESLHDALTGLPNRSLFLRRLATTLAAAPDTDLAVLLMDLDRFKDVNDTLGHHHGDLLLAEVARRLTLLAQTTTSVHTVARLGGDEFAVLLAGVSSESAYDVSTAVRTALSRPYLLEGVRVEAEVSIGIVLAPLHGLDESMLLRRADVAMYAAKRRHTGSEFYDSARDEHSPRRLALATSLRQAIVSDQLRLHYQPQARVSDGVVTGMEALVRWQHPDLGLVAPDDFVPIAEQTGQIRELTEWVVRTAVGQLAGWNRAGLNLTMAVNLSTRNLLDFTLPELVVRLLGEHGGPPEQLILEVTETSIMSDPPRTLRVLRRLAEIGVRISIDDFGTGYSSLSHLKQMPAHEIKIDRSFVIELASDDDDAAIARSIINLAGILGLQVVAEGVEDEVSWRRLADMGCDLVQGYYLSRPMPAEDVPGWLRRNGPRLGDLRVVGDRRLRALQHRGPVP